MTSSLPNETSPKCGVCGSSDMVKCTGLDFEWINNLTLNDEEYGWSYLKCNDCLIVMNVYWLSSSSFYVDSVIGYDKNRIDELLKELEKDVLFTE